MINHDILATVTRTALAQVQARVAGPCLARRWHKAIRKGADQLAHNPYWHLRGDTLLVLSYSNRIYEAGASCDCAAAAEGFPCWHRAAFRLAQLCREATPPDT
jgi:hypothetical protein